MRRHRLCPREGPTRIVLMLVSSLRDLWQEGVRCSSHRRSDRIHDVGCDGRALRAMKRLYLVAGDAALPPVVQYVSSTAPWSFAPVAGL